MMKCDNEISNRRKIKIYKVNEFTDKSTEARKSPTTLVKSDVEALFGGTYCSQYRANLVY